jgi:hypothetical protein
MAHVQFTDVQDRPPEFLDLTSLTRDEFQQLVPPFEAAFQAHMAAWRLDGKPRTARRFGVYRNCPLPTPEDRLLYNLPDNHPCDLVSQRYIERRKFKQSPLCLNVLTGRRPPPGDRPHATAPRGYTPPSGGSVPRSR